MLNNEPMSKSNYEHKKHLHNWKFVIDKLETFFKDNLK